jgi:hypothetical protein
MCGFNAPRRDILPSVVKIDLRKGRPQEIFRGHQTGVEQIQNARDRHLAHRFDRADQVFFTRWTRESSGSGELQDLNVAYQMRRLIHQAPQKPRSRMRACHLT